MFEATLPIQRVIANRFWAVKQSLHQGEIATLLTSLAMTGHGCANRLPFDYFLRYTTLLRNHRAQGTPRFRFFTGKQSII